jgi:hypothetical protein
MELERVTLGDQQVDAIRRHAFGPAPSGEFSLRSIESGSWGTEEIGRFDVEEVSITGDGLVIKLAGADAEQQIGPFSVERAQQFMEANSVTVQLRLSDGLRVAARQGYFDGLGGPWGGELRLFSWECYGPILPRYWVFEIDGLSLSRISKNFYISAVDNQAARESHPGNEVGGLWLKGNLPWAILERKDRTEALLDIQGPLDIKSASADLRALQFCLGRRFSLGNVARGIGDDGKIVAWVGMEFFGNTGRVRAEPPVPVERPERYCWLAELFAQLAPLLKRDDELGIAASIAVQIYLDTIYDPWVDSKHLKVQVALEAFCSRFLKSKRASSPQSLLVPTAGERG